LGRSCIPQNQIFPVILAKEEPTAWLNIWDTQHSQWAGREEVFEREREREPDFQAWNSMRSQYSNLARNLGWFLHP
jgi:hypothetical protein